MSEVPSVIKIDELSLVLVNCKTKLMGYLLSLEAALGGSDTSHTYSISSIQIGIPSYVRVRDNFLHKTKMFYSLQSLCLLFCNIIKAQSTQNEIK